MRKPQRQCSVEVKKSKSYSAVGRGGQNPVVER